MPPTAQPELSRAKQDELAASAGVGTPDAQAEQLTSPFLDPTAEMLAMSRSEDFRWLVEGLVFPSLETVRSRRAPAGKTGWQRQLASYWIKRMVRAPWIDPRGAAELIGVRETVGREDALVGGWTAGDRRIQLMVVPGALYFHTQIHQTCGDTTRERIAAALELARELFNLPGEPCEASWWTHQFGSFSAGRSSARAGEWYHTLSIVTDGRHVRYGFRPLVARPAVGRYVPQPREEWVPWFDQEWIDDITPYLPPLPAPGASVQQGKVP
jgi:hypothetical protein